MTDRQIDNAIDGAVRDLMDVDADPAFRARVLSRLEHPARRGRWFRFAALSAGVAAILLALLVTRARESAPPPALARNAPAPASSLVQPQPRAIDARQDTPVLAAQSGPVNRSRPKVPPLAEGDPTHIVAPGALVATVAEPSGVDTIDPLALIEPIGMSPIAQAPIALSEIVVPPMTPITELQIAPFEPRRARD